MNPVNAGRKLPPAELGKAVTQAARGEGEAFERLFGSAEDLLYRTGLGLTGDPQIAEEALAETALSLLKSLSSLRCPRHFYTWATRIMINHCYAQLRLRDKVIPIGPDRCSPALDFPGDQAWADFHDVRTALADLGEDHRAVVILRYLEGMSVAEVSATLGIPEGTVKSRLHYALRELRCSLHATQSGVRTGGVTNG